MSDEKVLTKEIAEQFLADDDMDLSEFTGIEDDAAEIISKYEDNLSLDGLTDLSDAAAESLSNHEDNLSLDGLMELSDAAAERLSKHRGSLRLGGLMELSDAAVESLCKHKGHLGLGGLTSLSDAAVERLAEYSDEVSLPLFSDLRNNDGTWSEALCRLVAKKHDSLTTSTCANRWGFMEYGSPLPGFVSHPRVAVGCGNCGCSLEVEFDADLGEYPTDIKPSLEAQGWKSFQHDEWDYEDVVRCPDCLPDSGCSQCGDAPLISVLGQEKGFCMDCDTQKLNCLLFGAESQD